MANIFKPGFRRHLLKNSSEASQGIFGGEEAMFKNMEESKKQALLTKSIMLQTKKPGKGGKPNAKGGKKPAAAGSKGKGKKNPKKRPNNKGAKKSSANSKEDSKEKDKKSDDPCKLTFESITFSHSSSNELCGCGASMDNTVSSIPKSADWLVSFPL